MYGNHPEAEEHIKQHMAKETTEFNKHYEWKIIDIKNRSYSNVCPGTQMYSNSNPLTSIVLNRNPNEYCTPPHQKKQIQLVFFFKVLFSRKILLCWK
jgi:hypothetical protein